MMTTMTFESFNTSPRRAAARRGSRPVSRVVAPAAQQVELASFRTRNDVTGTRSKQGIIALALLMVALHGTIYMAINRPMAIEPVVPKALPIVIEMAPPPPPPPIIKPKPLPQVVKPIVRPAPSLPVVKTPDTTEATPDSVQVAKTAAPAPVEESMTAPRGFAGYQNNPAPNYPPDAQRRRLQGRVLLNVHVLANGKPDDIKVFQSSGYMVLDESALKTVTSWSFDPAKRGNTAVDAWVKVPINFKLS